MNPSGDAKTFYKTHPSREAREIAEQKAKEAREQLREKIGLPNVNRIMASKSDGSESRR